MRSSTQGIKRQKKGKRKWLGENYQLNNIRKTLGMEVYESEY